MKHITLTIALLVASIGFAAGHAAAAQPPGLPTGPIKIVVGFTAGGAADMVARTYAEHLRAEGLDQIVVDNRAGASSRIAVESVQNAPPDGLTLLLGQGPIFTIYPSLYKHLGFEPTKGLLPVASLVDIPTALVAAKDRPYSNMRDYVAWTKKNPKEANVGLAALGTSGHLGTIALGKELGVDIAPVVYKGSAPMLIDVSSGLVSIGWDAAASMLPLYKAGKIKFLAISGTQRQASLPEVPTAKEQGFGQFDHATSFYSIYVPTGTPQSTIDALQAAFLGASKNRALVDRLQNAGLVMAPLPANELSNRIAIERSFWEPIVKSSGIALE